MEKNYFKDIFTALPAPYLVLQPLDSSFIIVDANEAYLEVAEKKKEDCIGKSVFSVFPPNPDLKINGLDLLKQSLKKVEKTAKKDKISCLRYDIPSGDNKKFTEKYWSLENTPVLNKNGEVAYILHSVQDLTPQILSENQERKTREELVEIKQKSKHFIESNPDGLFSLDINGKFTSANEGLAKIAELPLEKLLKMSFRPFSAPHDKEKVERHFQKALQNQSTSFEADFISAKGKKIVLLVSKAPMKLKGEIIGTYGIAKDITYLRNSEKVLVEKKNFLQANASFISSLLENDLDESSLKEAFSLIGEAAGVDRMYYFGADNNKGTKEIFISQKIEWTSKRAVPQINNPEMQNMPACKLEQLMGKLTRNQPFTATLSRLPEGYLKEIFLDQDIKSMLLLPVFIKTNLYGFIGFDDCKQEREWKEDEVTFLKGLAHNLTTALEKRKAEEAILERETALRRSEKKFKALVQEGSDLMGIIDKEGHFKFVSDSYTSILGFSTKELVGLNAFELVHPEDKENLLGLLKELYGKKQIKTPPFRFRDAEGNLRWFETTATNLLNDPVVQGIVINSRDISTIVNQAREIEEINERYRLSATATQDLIYDWDLETDQVVRFHKGNEKIYGYPTQEVNQKKFWCNQIHPEEFNEVRKELHRAFSDPEENFVRTRYRFKRADSSYAHVIDRGNIIRNKEGKAIRLVGATSDISELKDKEAALQLANRRFKLAMKASNEMIWDWDILNDTVNRSKSFGKIYGYTNAEKDSMKNFWLPKIDPKDRKRILDSLQEILSDREQKKWREEYQFIKANGDTAFVIDRGYIVRDANGKAIQMIGATLDVTASREQIKEIKKQNHILKEIAWEQSHVVRAPLARLKGLLCHLEMESFDEMSRAEIIQHLNTSADELDTIVRKIVIKTEEISDESQLVKGA